MIWPYWPISYNPTMTLLLHFNIGTICPPPPPTYDFTTIAGVMPLHKKTTSLETQLH